MNATVRTISALMLFGVIAACGDRPPPIPTDEEFQRVLQTRLLDARPGEVIELPAGRFSLDRSLSLRVDDVTLRGAGMDRTVLSFKGQRVGAEGLLVNADGFTLENLAFEDTRGDAVKITEGERITIRGVRVEWTRGPNTDNGAYGLYPVRTRQVLIEDCLVIGASDAGIYVGQSEDIIVRRNRARLNVAGIEIENSLRADVYDNEVTANTGGILVFNMPNLPQRGEGARVFRNRIQGNNTANFAARGTPVASVPAGSGVVVNSNDSVEIFDNDFADNATAHVIISSYFSTGYMTDQGVAESFDPYPEAIYVHGNRYSGGGESPDGLDLQALRIALFGVGGRFPPVLWDGYLDAAKLVDGRLPADKAICVQGAGGVLNADGPGRYRRPRVIAEPFDCRLAALPAVVFAKAE